MIAGETPEGWYADPQVAHPAAERWWNGVQWTAHTRRTAGDPTSAGHRTPGPGESAEHRVVVAPAPPPPPPAPPVPQRVAAPAVTPYGVALADFWPRVVAWVVDMAAVSLLGLPLALALVGGSGLSLPWALGLCTWVIFAVYHYLTLAHRGATWGQRLLGIGVRPWQEHARLTAEQLVLRTVACSVVHLGALVPGLRAAGQLAWLALAATTLGSGRSRRGLHETWSDTCVVRTR